MRSLPSTTEEGGGIRRRRIQRGGGEQDVNNVAERKEGLKRFLMEHELFGRVLGNIGRLIEDALAESGGGGTLQ
jgi:hypothetical protein